MVRIRTFSQTAEGPRVQIDGGTIVVFTHSSTEPFSGQAVQPETQYVDVASERTVVVGELSKMEQILEYLKALYR